MNINENGKAKFIPEFFVNFTVKSVIHNHNIAYYCDG